MSWGWAPLLLAVLGLVALGVHSWAHQCDPAYKGIHRPGAGRHREREWQTGEFPLVKPSCDQD